MERRLQSANFFLCLLLPNLPKKKKKEKKALLPAGVSKSAVHTVKAQFGGQFLKSWSAFLSKCCRTLNCIAPISGAKAPFTLAICKKLSSLLRTR
jgi:hypothetical protein